MGELSNPGENVVAVAALVRKRRDVAFEIIQLEAQTEAKRALLIHLDATIREFAPDLAPADMPERQRRPRRLDYFKHGEISRRCFDLLRVGGTISSIDVVKQAMADKGLSFEGDRRIRSEFVRRITSQLGHMARKGTVEKLGFGRSTRWKLAGEA